MPMVAYSQNESFKEHTIQRGETLEIIAKRYGISTGDLSSANPNVKKCYAGQTLKIPVSLITTSTTKLTAEEPEKPKGKSFWKKVGEVAEGVGKVAAMVGQVTVEAATILSEQGLLEEMGTVGAGIAVVADITNVVNGKESNFSESFSQSSNSNYNYGDETYYNIDPNSTNNPYNMSINEIDRRISVLLAKDRELEEAKVHGYHPNKRTSSQPTKTSAPLVNKATGKINKKAVLEVTAPIKQRYSQKTSDRDYELAKAQSAIQKEIRELRAIKAEILNDPDIKKEKTDYEIDRSNNNRAYIAAKEKRTKAANSYSNQKIQNIASDEIWSLEHDPDYRPELKGSERKAEIERQKAKKEAARQANQL